MINAVVGKIVKLQPDYVTVLTPGGIEYRLEISQNTSSKLSADTGKERVRILAILQHREDAMVLFGFYDEDERFCFEQLQTVPGIGAKQAQKILSGITVQNLVKLLDAQDVKALSKVSGIGPKTAQKLVLQLRNVLVLDDEEETGAAEDKGYRDLIDSFVQMGFDRKLVARTLNEVIRENALLIDGKSREESENILLPLMLKRMTR